MSLEAVTLQHKVSAANLPLERLAGAQSLNEQEKLAEVSRQFESVLLHQILAQAQKPLFAGAALGASGPGAAIYQDMITQQLADRISQGGSFGFAKVLEKELTSRYVKKEPAPVSAAGTRPKQVEQKIRMPTFQGAPVPVEKPTEKKIQVRPQPGKRI